jgi:hypothetical protein
MIKTPVHRH